MGYPTAEHERAAERVVEFFSERGDVEAVLLTCSCARGKAAPDSCLDVAILIAAELPGAERRELEQAWGGYCDEEPAFAALQRVGKYSFVDLEWFDGRFEPGEHGWTTGADAFELEIGNLVAYSVPLWEGGERLQQLRAEWLPYYDEALRQERLEMVRRYCLNNLDHIPLYAQRGLHFQAFDRLYNAMGEFLQALFITRRAYPIAYDKWVREQVEEMLGLPEVYGKLVGMLEIGRLGERELLEKMEVLEGMLEAYCTA